jgi:hypothetical protein
MCLLNISHKWPYAPHQGHFSWLLVNNQPVATSNAQSQNLHANHIVIANDVFHNPIKIETYKLMIVHLMESP